MQALLYQFPMGKVKSFSTELVQVSTSYQFPMGKVKQKCFELVTLEFVYQFPMGKVKIAFKQHHMGYIADLYQFPMGKVKLIVTFKRKGGEENVSIPYGKGKEQHFVLRFYYNP